MLTTDVENYPGFVEGIKGPDLMENFRKQATRFGAEIINENVTSVDFKKNPFQVSTAENNYNANTIIIATGADSKEGVLQAIGTAWNDQQSDIKASEKAAKVSGPKAGDKRGRTQRKSFKGAKRSKPSERRKRRK